jgi:hypothetical protein
LPYSRLSRRLSYLKVTVVTGREAYQPRERLNAQFARPRSKRTDRCIHIAKLFALVSIWLLTVQTVQASDVDLPIVEPLHTIFVQAETVGKEVRGIYDVLAFEGNCRLRQGELQGMRSSLGRMFRD